MEINRITGKFLLAKVGDNEPLNQSVMTKIYDLCRRCKITEVGLVYPSLRIEELLPFMSKVVDLTGRPVRGFSYGPQPPLLSKTQVIQ